MVIRISNLAKTYRRGDTPVLDDVTLSIPHGTFGLLGPNGAGKTTLIKILSTQMDASSGNVTMDDFDLVQNRAEIRHRIGYLPQHFGTYPQLTAWEFLDYMGILGGIHNRTERLNRVEQALNEVGLYDARKWHTGTFSGGMVRRLGIAQAILTDPEFLIVDEPTVGLDPEERIRFRSILGRLSSDRAILISTHIVGDISSTCKDIAILNRGQLVFRGSPSDLISKADGKTWQIQVDEPHFEKLSRVFHVVTVNVEGDRMSVRMVGDGDPLADAEAVSPNLEDAYLYFMSGDITDEIAS